MLKQIIESPVKDRDDKYIDIGEDTLFKDVIEVKRSLAGSLYRSNMTMVEITLKGYYDALNEWVRYTRVVGANGQEATIDYGSFLVLENNYNDDTEETKLVAYDKMILAQTEYRQEDMDLTFPATIKAVFDRVLQVCGLETTTTSFDNMNELVEEEVWHNTQYTYRDVLDHIAQVSGSIIGIKNDKLEVYYPSQSDYTVQQKNLTSLKMGDDYGEINILNLTREPQHDNYAYAVYGGVEVVFSEIPVDERKELVFQNNPIVDKNREYWATKIFPLIADTSYKTFTANTLSGYGIFDIGDIVEVEEYNTGLTHTALITDEHTTHRHMLVSEVSSSKPFDSKERYVVVTDERREGQRTYILVDQLNGEIIAAVESIDELDGVVTEQGSSLSLLNDQVNVEIAQRITSAEGTLETINESISTVESTQQTFTDRITNLEGEMTEQQTFFRTGMDGLTIGGTDWETVMHADGERISFQSQTGSIQAHFGANGMYVNRWELDFHTIEKFEEGNTRGTIYKNRKGGS